MKYSSGLPLRPSPTGGPQPAVGENRLAMGDETVFSISEDSEFNYYVMSPEQDLDPYLFLSTDMDRTKVSGSSMNSGLSATSYPDPNYAPSPISSLGSPSADGDFTGGRSYAGQSQNSLLSPQTAAASRESSERSGLFNIEKDGDPKIHWRMYYDFIISKAEAYYQLQPGYLPTARYPTRVDSETITIDGAKRHPCGVLGCTAKPFTRHYDLERHFQTRHTGGKGQGSKEEGSKEQGAESQGERVHMNCDRTNCQHEERFRKDHCREHYREFHNEDLIKRGQPKQKHSKKKPETVEEFLAARIKNLNLNWWRCSRCLGRVYLDPNGYICPTCNLACEEERMKCRENARKASNKTQGFGSAQTGHVVVGCGACQNAWVPDETSPNGWSECSRCQPGAFEN